MVSSSSHNLTLRRAILLTFRHPKSHFVRQRPALFVGRMDRRRHNTRPPIGPIAPSVLQRQQTIRQLQQQQSGNRHSRHRPRRTDLAHLRRQQQLVRAQMGELLECGSVMRQVLLNIHPFRKYIWVICALCVLLALLIVGNSVWLIYAESNTPYHLSDPTFVIFSEVLAWLLILLSVFGVKLTCMSTKAVEESARRRVPNDELPTIAIDLDDAMQRLRPFSAPNWLSWTGNEFGDLPGAVLAESQQQQPQLLFDPAQFPAPPPRYSSLGPAPQPIPSVVVVPPPVPTTLAPRRSSHHQLNFARSPPPPYFPDS